MQSRVFSLVLFFLSFGLFSFASPVETTQLEARDNEKRAIITANVVADLVADVNVALAGLATVVVDADVVAHIGAVATAFTKASNGLKGVGPASLSTADKNAIAKNVATAINNSAASIGKVKQTAAIINANILLDAQINIFLNVLGLIVANISIIIAPLIINLKLLLSLHLTIVANIFINILGIVIIL
ncbi:hypothetical protein AURDEDRAFT_115941 [Auricularia subglabra TFB-10046 SS5]|nr:hypothetical protein AURDEDRAFT_115941 [Auricularia subglabra TFB-10046 SS5]